MKKDDLNKYIINEDATIVDAMQAIDRGSKGIVFVVDENLILKRNSGLSNLPDFRQDW